MVKMDKKSPKPAFLYVKIVNFTHSTLRVRPNVFQPQSIASKGLEFDRNIPDSAEMIADKIDEKNF